MNVQHKDFADRIARIEAGENSFKSMIFVGNDETYRPEDLRRAVRKKPGRMTTQIRKTPKHAPKSRRFSMLSVPLACVVGALAFVIWRMADFQMQGMASLYADPVQTFAINAATGMALAILCCQALSLTAPQHVLAAFGGLVAMTFGFHHVVNLAPDQFALMFSPAWVGQLMAMGPPSALILG